MGTVHAKSKEKFGDFGEGAGIDLSRRNAPGEDPEREPMKEIHLEGVRARVDTINVDGLSRTKNDIIEDCIRELFRAKDFQDVLLKTHVARLKLDELGCFKNISVFIDTSKGPKATPDGLEVTFNVKEYKRLTGGISTHVGNNEGSVLVGMRTPNLFGRGERIQMEYSHGSKKTSNFNVAFIKPFRGQHRPTFSTSAFQAHSEWPNSGYKQLDEGLLFDLGFHSLPTLKHNIQWEATVRDLSVLTKETSFDVRKESGVSLKSAVKHILSIDLRDDTIFPTGGPLFQLTSELAGIGGDVGYLKTDFFLQGNYSILEDIVVQGCFSGGYMKSLNPDMKIGICDKYYLGGPLSIRGFETRGVGRHSDGDALGAMTYWSAGLHLFAPLPFRPGRGGFGDLFKAHLFVNAGNLGDFHIGKDSNLLQNLITDMRISYGLGIALRLGNMARLEVNYCFPYEYIKGDQAHPGVQFGIGVRFL